MRTFIGRGCTDLSECELTTCGGSWRSSSDASKRVELKTRDEDFAALMSSIEKDGSVDDEDV